MSGTPKLATLFYSSSILEIIFIYLLMALCAINFNTNSFPTIFNQIGPYLRKSNNTHNEPINPPLITWRGEKVENSRLVCAIRACVLAQAACMRHTCLRAPCVAWPLLLTSFTLLFLFSPPSVFCF